MSDEILAELAVCQVPYLDEAIPSSTHNERDLYTGRKTDAGDPFRVSFSVARNGVLALSKSVPEANGSIARSCGRGVEEYKQTIEYIF